MPNVPLPGITDTMLTEAHALMRHMLDTTAANITFSRGVLEKTLAVEHTEPARGPAAVERTGSTVFALIVMAEMLSAALAILVCTQATARKSLKVVSSAMPSLYEAIAVCKIKVLEFESVREASDYRADTGMFKTDADRAVEMACSAGIVGTQLAESCASVKREAKRRKRTNQRKVKKAPG